MGKKKQPTKTETLPVFDLQPRISAFFRPPSPEGKETSHAQSTQASSLQPPEQSYDDMDEDSNAVGLHML